MPFTPEQKAAAESCRSALIENMDVGIGMNLYASNIFLNREHQLVKNEITDEEKRAKILEILVTKDPAAWNTWLEYLRKSKQGTLAQQLATALQNQNAVEY